jgi:hypothetical protein
MGNVWVLSFGVTKSRAAVAVRAAKLVHGPLLTDNPNNTMAKIETVSA